MTDQPKPSPAEIEAIAEIRGRLEKITQPPWWPGHLANDEHPCRCANVLSEHFAGAVATVHFNNGKAISDGGNDAPPLEQAKANLRFIANAPTDMRLLLSELDRITGERDEAVQLAANRLDGNITLLYMKNQELREVTKERDEAREALEDQVVTRGDGYSECRLCLKMWEGWDDDGHDPSCIISRAASIVGSAT